MNFVFHQSQELKPTKFPVLVFTNSGTRHAFLSLCEISPRANKTSPALCSKESLLLVNKTVSLFNCLHFKANFSSSEYFKVSFHCAFQGYYVINSAYSNQPLPFKTCLQIPDQVLKNSEIPVAINEGNLDENRSYLFKSSCIARESASQLHLSETKYRQRNDKALEFKKNKNKKESFGYPLIGSCHGDAGGGITRSRASCGIGLRSIFGFLHLVQSCGGWSKIRGVVVIDQS